MILTASTRTDDRSSETDLDYVSRLWLRTALAAWLLWLGPLAAAVMTGAVR